MGGLVRAVLAGLGVTQVEVVHRSDLAWRQLGLAHYDVLIVDRRLGDTDGLDLVRRLRRAPGPAARTPVIMVTASGDLAGVRAARDAGVDEFLVKPFTVGALAEHLSAALERRRPFINTEAYVGPDRRRRADPEYRGGERRRTGAGGTGTTAR